MKTVEFKNNSLWAYSHIITSFLKNVTSHLAYQFCGSELTIGGFNEEELKRAKEFIDDVLHGDATCLVASYVAKDKGRLNIMAIFRAHSEKVYEVEKVSHGVYIVYFKRSAEKNADKLLEYFDCNPGEGMDVYTLGYDGVPHRNNLIRIDEPFSVNDSSTPIELVLVYKDRFAHYDSDTIQRVLNNVNIQFSQTEHLVRACVRSNGTTSFFLERQIVWQTYLALMEELDRIEPVQVGTNCLYWIKTTGFKNENTQFRFA